MAYFRCGDSKPKEMIVKGTSETSSSSSIIFDVTLPCGDFSKLDVDYFDSNYSVNIYGIDSEEVQTTIQNGSIKSKTTLDIANYSKVRFYGVNTSGTFFNGFVGNIRFYN